MRAVVLDAPHAELRVVERPEPEGADVIDVLACGVCHSDLHVVDGDYPSPMPLVLGHEVAGLHPQLGPVLVYAPWGCLRCDMCAAGNEMICPDAKEIGLFQDGGYCERFAVKDRRYLHPLGDLDPLEAAPLACGGLTAWRAVDHVTSTLRALGTNGRVLVVGAGGLGQFAVQYLRTLTDAQVIVTDLNASKRAHAVTLGAHAAVGAETLDEDGATFHAIVDFVGSEATLQLAARRVRRQGIVVVVGLFGGRIPFGLGAVAHEARFMSSIWGSNDQLGQLVAYAQQHRLRSTIEALPLSHAEQAHRRLRSGDVSGRFVLVPSLDN